MSKNLQSLARPSATGETPFTRLGQAAAEGPLTPAALAALAASQHYPAAPLLGTLSFYDFLRPEQGHKRAWLCHGTACRFSSGQGQARAALAAHYPAEEIGEMACVGHCYHGGGLVAAGRSLDAESLHLLDSADPAAPIPFHCLARQPVLSGPLPDLTTLYAALALPPAQLLAELNHSGLRGRGGAGFPFARKLSACMAAPAGQKYVVCNADEGDPGAFSDRWLLEEQPHRVLAGMAAAALACGADRCIIYLRAEYPQALPRLQQAIAELAATPFQQQSGLHFQVVQGAGAYICGEETALLNSIEGRRPEVRVRPPFPAQAGLFDRPTLLSNVETFAALPWILQHGGAAYAAIGTERSSGTKLVSLDHRFLRPGVYEVEMGMGLADLIQAAGGLREPIKALQIGGPLGGIIPFDQLPPLTLDFESFQRHGFLLGHAGVIALPTTLSLVEFAIHLFGYMADESCGKCVPCRLGTRSGHHLLQQAATGTPIDRASFDELLTTLADGSLCALGGGLPLPMRNLLDHFPEEFAPLWSSAG